MTVSEAFRKAEVIEVQLSPANWPDVISFHVTKKALKEAVGGKIALLNDPDLASWKYDNKRLIIFWAT